MNGDLITTGKESVDEHFKLLATEQTPNHDSPSPAEIQISLFEVWSRIGNIYSTALLVISKASCVLPKKIYFYNLYTVFVNFHWTKFVT